MVLIWKCSNSPSYCALDMRRTYIIETVSLLSTIFYYSQASSRVSVRKAQQEHWSLARAKLCHKGLTVWEISVRWFNFSKPTHNSQGCMRCYFQLAGFMRFSPICGPRNSWLICPSKTQSGVLSKKQQHALPNLKHLAWVWQKREVKISNSLARMVTRS